jgi:cysteine desulfurase/selenocysteine lyase
VRQTFWGQKNPIAEIKQIAITAVSPARRARRGLYLHVDGAQLVPNSFMDVKRLGNSISWPWSFHKMLAPFGVGAHVLQRESAFTDEAFHYGGDMIAEGKGGSRHR